MKTINSVMERTGGNQTLNTINTLNASQSLSFK